MHFDICKGLWYEMRFLLTLAALVDHLPGDRERRARSLGKIHERPYISSMRYKYPLCVYPRPRGKISARNVVARYLDCAFSGVRET